MSINRLPNISALIYGLFALTSAMPMLCLSNSRDNHSHPPRHSWLLAAEHHHHLQQQQQKGLSSSASTQNQDHHRSPNAYSIPFESVRLDKHEKASSITNGKKKSALIGSKQDDGNDIYDDSIDDYERNNSPHITTNTSNILAGSHIVAKQRELASVIRVKPIIKPLYLSHDHSNQESNSSSVLVPTSTIGPHLAGNRSHFNLIESAGALIGKPEVLTIGADAVDVSESSRVEHNSKCALILKRTYILRKKHTDEWGDKFVFNDIDTDDKKK